jgi:sulfide dehydrogenase cytochrome subunit
MLQFLDGTREGDAMTKLMKKYDADQSAAFAWHFAKRKWQSVPSETQAELVKRGKALHDAACTNCHANGGRKTDAETPRIAGQPLEFLENEIKRYQDPAVKLPNKFMRNAVKSLTTEEVKALAHYYASQKELIFLE